MLIRLHGNATATPTKLAYIHQNRHRPTAELERELVWATGRWCAGKGVLTVRTLRRGRTDCAPVWRIGSGTAGRGKVASPEFAHIAQH